MLRRVNDQTMKQEEKRGKDVMKMIEQQRQMDERKMLLMNEENHVNVSSMKEQRLETENERKSV